MQTGKIISSLIYQLFDRLLVKGLGLIISIILARLLSPTEFGQVAIIMVFINLSMVLIDSGLNSALVQNADISDEDYSTVFYISLTISLILIGVIFSCAPFIASYYQDCRLIFPLRVYSFSLILGAVKSVVMAKMQREMMFKQMMWCNLVSCVFSGVIGVLMAYYGYGIWALIAYYISSSLITCLLLVIAVHWSPKLVFSYQRAKVLFSFGSKMLVSGLLCSLYNDIRSLVIGKVYSPSQLGFYNRGEQFPLIVSQTLDNAIQSVMFPVMSRVQDVKSQVKFVLKRTFSTAVLIILPIMFAMVLMARPLVELLLTSKWLPAVPYMQCICIGCATTPMVSSCLVAIKSLGRSDVYMKLELVRRSIMTMVLFMSIYFFDSVLAIAIGFAISAWLDYFIISIIISRLLHYGIKEQLLDMCKPMIASVVMCGCISILNYFELADFIHLLLQLIVGVVSYTLLCYILKVESLTYLMQILLKRQKI